jgi:hypothetical protein
VNDAPCDKLRRVLKQCTEQQRVVLARTRYDEHLDERVRESAEGPVGLLGETSAFRFGHNELAGDASECAAYPQQLRVKINIGPRQGKRIAAA